MWVLYSTAIIHGGGFDGPVDGGAGQMGWCGATTLNVLQPEIGQAN